LPPANSATHFVRLGTASALASLTWLHTIITISGVSRWLTVAAAVCVCASASDAQRSTTFAVDAAVGAGTARGGEFVDRDLTGARLAASIRRAAIRSWVASGIGASCPFDARGEYLSGSRIWGVTLYV
jgi:hypothetical protein